MSLITIERKILEKNDAIAKENTVLFHEQNLYVVNMISSPGSGKTSLIEKTIPKLQDLVKMAVIEGDVQTDLDAQRIDKLNVPVVQIVTNGACHLDAVLVRDAFQKIPYSNINLLFIENVGNLICPAEYDLGENMKILVISVTEGEDKPLKYPNIFRKADILIINKIDLLPYINFSIKDLIANSKAVNPKLKIFPVSCTAGQGLDEWCEYLINRAKNNEKPG